MGVIDRIRPARVKVPTILQMEAVECGAASLAMVLACFGRMVPLAELRLACGVSRDGSKATNLLKAANGQGLTARAYKKEPEDLRAFKPPFIVHWNFNHFLVVEGIGRKRIYLNDPACGPRSVTHAEFDKSFTGVVLTFEPGPNFERTRGRRNVFAALRARLSGSSLALLYVLLAGLLLVIPGLVMPAYLKLFVDDVLIGGMSAWARPLIAAMIATSVVAASLTWLQQNHLLRLETKYSLTTSSKFFWHVLRLPVDFFNQRHPAEIGNRVGINDRIAQLLSGDLANTALAACTVCFYAALMLRYDAWLTAITVITTMVNLAAARYTARRRMDLSRRLLQDQSLLMATGMGGLQSIETLKAMGTESDFFARWSGYQAKTLDSQQHLRLQTDLLATVPPLLAAISMTLTLGLGGRRVMDGQMTVGTLVAFQMLVLAFTAPAARMVDFGNTFQEVRGQIDRLDDVLEAEADGQASVQAGESLEPAPKLAGEIELRDVSFGYCPLDPPFIQHFNLKVRPGRRVALVGGSGSGKSTVAKLVCGLYKPWSGQILFDGVARHEVPRAQMTNSFAVVDQDIFLFEGTIAENITLWDPTVPEADLVRAAADACIHEDVMARQDGYAGKVEESGRNFSGGQRQRLEIARALVGNPTVMVLDEATSALDPATEKAFDDRVRRRGCTCLIIAHRLSTIRDCDEIVVLDHGRIVQRGTHDEMKEVPGPYAKLISHEAQ